MFKLVTNHPVATYSPDHLLALSEGEGGAAKDNSRQILFNERLYKLFPGKQLWIMDIGCSGGGFVRDCVRDGHIAIGLEGSDYSYTQQRAEWPVIPDNLFVCDFSKPFNLYYDDKLAQFDVLTAWEVMEHFDKPSLPQVCRNILTYLKNGGLFICSISYAIGPPYHQTIEQAGWWISLFNEFGFQNDTVFPQHFHPYWVRNEPFSFPLVLRKNV